MEVMDTTLRDGEQTPGVNYTPDEKLIIAEALLRSGVDAIEIASAKISDGEAQAVQRITKWARSHELLDRIEILGFVDRSSKSLVNMKHAVLEPKDSVCELGRRWKFGFGGFRWKHSVDCCW
jgi:isopropylmalate/homocitrate/citramalate synthase